MAGAQSGCQHGPNHKKVCWYTTWSGTQISHWSNEKKFELVKTCYALDQPWHLCSLFVDSFSLIRFINVHNDAKYGRQTQPWVLICNTHAALGFCENCMDTYKIISDPWLYYDDWFLLNIISCSIIIADKHILWKIFDTILYSTGCYCQQHIPALTVNCLCKFKLWCCNIKFTTVTYY